MQLTPDVTNPRSNQLRVIITTCGVFAAWPALTFVLV